MYLDVVYRLHLSAVGGSIPLVTKAPLVLLPGTMQPRDDPPVCTDRLECWLFIDGYYALWMLCFCSLIVIVPAAAVAAMRPARRSLTTAPAGSPVPPLRPRHRARIRSALLFLVSAVAAFAALLALRASRDTGLVGASLTALHYVALEAGAEEVTVLSVRGATAAAAAPPAGGRVSEVDAFYARVGDGRDLIMGVMDPLPALLSAFDPVTRWLASLRATGSAAHVALFTQHLPSDPQLLAALAPYNVTVVTFSRGRSPLLERMLPPPLRPVTAATSSLRFVLYDRFLADFGARYNRVMTSDVTDVVFQRCPFTALPRATAPPGDAAPALIAPTEVHALLLPDVSAIWLIKCVGYAAYARLSGSPIACSGTTLGASAAMAAYVRAQAELARGSRWCAEETGVDQGAHQHVVYGGILPGVAVATPGFLAGPVATLAGASDLHFDADGLLLNGAGQPYHVVHQVNRCVPGMLRPNQNFSCAALTDPAWLGQKRWRAAQEGGQALAVLRP